MIDAVDFSDSVLAFDRRLGCTRVVPSWHVEVVDRRGVRVENASAVDTEKERIEVWNPLRERSEWRPCPGVKVVVLPKYEGAER